MEKSNTPRTFQTVVAELETLMATKGYKKGYEWRLDQAEALRTELITIVENTPVPTQEERDAQTPERTWENVKEKLSTGKGFTTCPGDVFTIEHTPGVISSTLVVTFNNERRGERFTMSLDNKLATWEFLKGLDDMGGRMVDYHSKGRYTIRFRDSIPYIHRFGTKLEA